MVYVCKSYHDLVVEANLEQKFHIIRGELHSISGWEGTRIGNNQYIDKEIKSIILGHKKKQSNGDLNSLSLNPSNSSILGHGSHICAGYRGIMII